MSNVFIVVLNGHTGRQSDCRADVIWFKNEHNDDVSRTNEKRTEREVLRIMLPCLRIYIQDPYSYALSYYSYWRCYTYSKCGFSFMLMFESVLVYIILVHVINILSSAVLNELRLVLTSSSHPPCVSWLFVFSFIPLKSDTDFHRQTGGSVRVFSPVKDN